MGTAVAPMMSKMGWSVTEASAVGETCAVAGLVLSVLIGVIIVNIGTARNFTVKNIEKNFNSSLSREELADSVNIHPDNVGRNFKGYTGKKISDYIYELRVNEAARRLVETNDSIHIAFSVGFESLRTFNRVFPQIKNTTPEKYRSQHKNSEPNIENKN